MSTHQTEVLNFKSTIQCKLGDVGYSKKIFARIVNLDLTQIARYLYSILFWSIFLRQQGIVAKIGVCPILNQNTQINLVQIHGTHRKYPGSFRATLKKIFLLYPFVRKIWLCLKISLNKKNSFFFRKITFFPFDKEKAKSR